MFPGTRGYNITTFQSDLLEKMKREPGESRRNIRPHYKSEPECRERGKKEVGWKHPRLQYRSKESSATLLEIFPAKTTHYPSIFKEWACLNIPSVLIH